MLANNMIHIQIRYHDQMLDKFLDRVIEECTNLC